MYYVQLVPQTGEILKKYIRDPAKKYGKRSENISVMGWILRDDGLNLYADMWR